MYRSPHYPCHNPILTFRIFSDTWHAKQGNPINLKTNRIHLNMLKSANLRPRFEDIGILPSFIKFSQV